ncbi:MAG: hypothetical protein AABY32_00615 [Nanoarchaeota archaeon]
MKKSKKKTMIQTKTKSTYTCSMFYKDLKDNLKVWRVKTYRTTSPQQATKNYVDDIDLPGGIPLGPYYAYVKNKNGIIKLFAVTRCYKCFYTTKEEKIEKENEYEENQ